MKANYAITHGGKAHRDDVLAVGLAMVLGIIDAETPVYRREPTEGELDDPKVLVLDIGQRFEPELNNFDHHQPGFSEDCALSLLAKTHLVPRGLLLQEISTTEVCKTCGGHGRLATAVNLLGEAKATTPCPDCSAQKVEDKTVHDLLKDRPWYQGVIIQDTLGPKSLARFAGLGRLSETPPELRSPFDSYILHEIKKQQRMSPWWMRFMEEVLRKKIVGAILLQKTMEEMGRAARVWSANKADGKKITVIDVTPCPPIGMNDYIREKNLSISVTVAKDPRTGGKVLYRLEESAVDFSKIAGEENVVFAHGQGFVAIVDPSTSEKRVGELILKAM